jgi:hypothetical protein
MFLYPCSLRSAQCATLIALAAAAGVARVEPSSHRPTSEPTASARSSSALELLARPNQLLARNSAAVPGEDLAVCWIAHWFLQNLEYPATTPGTGQDPAGGHDTAVAFQRTTLRTAPTGSAAIARHQVPSLLPPSVTPHLLPFAVGPPFHRTPLDPNAVGTPVPGDSTVARSSLTLVAAPDEVSSPDARLARLLAPIPALQNPDPISPDGPAPRSIRSDLSLLGHCRSRLSLLDRPHRVAHPVFTTPTHA